MGYLIFDGENELKIEKLYLIWKLDSKGFPTSYHVPNLDTGKAYAMLLEKGATHKDGAAHWAVLHSAKNTLAWRIEMTRCIGLKSLIFLKNSLNFPKSLNSSIVQVI